RERTEPGLDEVLLAGAELDRTVRADEVAHVGEGLGGYGHGRVPEVAAARAWAMVPTGSTWWACPAVVTAPGIPHTTDVCSSWARTWPPARAISPAPSRPSDPMPVSTSARRSPPSTRTAERNSTSTAGRVKLTGGPSVSSVRTPAPWPTTSRCRPPGARYACPGSSGSFPAASTTVVG